MSKSQRNVFQAIDLHFELLTGRYPDTFGSFFESLLNDKIALVRLVDLLPERVNDDFHVSDILLESLDLLYADVVLLVCLLFLYFLFEAINRLEEGLDLLRMHLVDSSNLFFTTCVSLLRRLQLLLELRVLQLCLLKLLLVHQHNLVFRVVRLHFCAYLI